MQPCAFVNRKNGKRVDDRGRAYAGSQRQLQTYVNERTDELSADMLKAIDLEVPPSTVEWVSPLAQCQYAEYKDTDFLNALGLGLFRHKLLSFWPNSGPRWDGLARFRVGSEFHYVLVEAKRHVSEMFSNGCCAKSPDSLAKIRAAFAVTKSWLGVNPHADWTGPLYQYANRLAHLYWFRQVLGMPAWLVNIYFTDDPHSPTSLSNWKTGLADAKAALGISGVQIPGTADLFLPACD